MKLVAYLRVSTEGQRENTSMEAQYERIAAYCAFQGHEMFLICRDVETATGKKKRHGLELALQQIYDGHADGLICLKLDRFARSTVEGLKIAAELKQRGKQLVLINEALDTTNAVGECIFTILLAFAQLEHATIRERVRSGRDKVKERDGYTEGSAPFGYRNAKDEDGNKILERDPYEYPWRQQIVRWREAGWGLRTIANELNRLDVKLKYGKKWYPASIRNMLLHTKMVEWAERVHERRQIKMGRLERETSAS